MLLPLMTLLALAMPSASSVSSSAPVSASDQALLRRIHIALVTLDDKKAWFVKFERTVRPDEARAAQTLLPRLKPNTEAYGEVAFAGAYYGLDYDANLRRVARPCLLSYEQWNKDYGNAHEKFHTRLPFFDCDLVWFELNVLYLKRHDLKSLGLWLDLKTDGAVAEGSGDALSELWKHHKNDILRAACNKPARIEQLAGVFVYTMDLQTTRAVHKVVKTLRPLTRNPDPTVARGAQQLIASLNNSKN